VVATVIDRLDHVRRLVPVRYVTPLVERKVGRLWQNEDYRRAQEEQMRHLLEFTSRAPEIPELARRSAEFHLAKTYLRWHPKRMLNQRFEGIEWLTTRRDRDRCTIVSFVHHNEFEGMFGSLARAGAPCHVLALPLVMGAEATTWMRQHMRIVSRGSTVLPAEGGVDALADRLRPGMIFAIALDVPGHTEATFLGRKVLAPLGTALIASRTNSPVVVAGARRGDDGDTWIHLSEPIEPGDFAGPRELLDELMRRHEETVLAWPEAFVVPGARWGIPEG
jgi:lauroyl/myristoyl acyltransferase